MCPMALSTDAYKWSQKSVQDAPTANDHDCNGRKANQAHTDARPTKSEWDSAENLIDGADGEQSLR